MHFLTKIVFIYLYYTKLFPSNPNSSPDKMDNYDYGYNYDYNCLHYGKQDADELHSLNAELKTLYVKPDNETKEARKARICRIVELKKRQTAICLPHILKEVTEVRIRMEKRSAEYKVLGWLDDLKNKENDSN